MRTKLANLPVTRTAGCQFEGNAGVYRMWGCCCNAAACSNPCSPRIGVRNAGVRANLANVSVIWTAGCQFEGNAGVYMSRRYPEIPAFFPGA